MIRRIALAACILLVGTFPASPQRRSLLPVQAPTIVKNPITSFFATWTAEDIRAAIELSTSIPSLQDTTGKECWTTFLSIGDILKAHPLPLSLKLATDIESARLVNLALRAVCKKPECSQVFADLSNQIGALAPIGLPISFTAICQKIP